MSASKPAAARYPDENKSARDTTIKVPGFEASLPLPPWAVSVIACVVIVGLACSGYYTIIFPHMKTDEALRQSVDPFTLRQLQESQKHAGEQPSKTDSVYQGDRGQLAVSYYPTDGCLLVARRTSDPAVPQMKLWVQELTQKNLSPAPGRISVLTGPRGSSLVAPAFAVEQKAPCSGRCLSKHPGAFKSWTGEKRGCWVQVWREWPDGCKHYQWFNSCSSYWDEKNGVQRLYWSCCNH